jgi:hypothetical protein
MLYSYVHVLSGDARQDHDIKVANKFLNTSARLKYFGITGTNQK